MRCNKKELAAKLNVSERALSHWQKEGLPVLEHGRRGQQNAYDLAAVVKWLKRTGRGSDFKANGAYIDFKKLDRELGIDQAPPARPREVIFAEEMFLMAAQAIQDGKFEEIEPAMRKALRLVPDDLRHLVGLHVEVMNLLIADVLTVVDDVQSEKQGTESALPRSEKMSDAEADEMGTFWYQVAAGEWKVADTVQTSAPSADG